MTAKLAPAIPKRRTAGRVALVLAIAATLFAVAELTWGGQRGARPLESIVRLLEARSPGERKGATLSKQKKKVPKESGDELHERVLGKAFPSPPPNVVPPRDLLIAPPPLVSLEIGYAPNPPSGMLQDIPTPAGAVVYYDAPTGPGSNNGGGFGGSSGGGGGGGSGDGPINGSVPPLVPKVPSAVPEPESWALMLLGAVLAAAAMRRGNALRRRRAVCDVNA